VTAVMLAEYRSLLIASSSTPGPRYSNST